MNPNIIAPPDEKYDFIFKVLEINFYGYVPRSEHYDNIWTYDIISCDKESEFKKYTYEEKYLVPYEKTKGKK